MKVDITFKDVSPEEALKLLGGNQVTVTHSVGNVSHTVTAAAENFDPSKEFGHVVSVPLTAGQAGPLPGVFEPNQHSNPDNDEDDNSPANANAPLVDARGFPWDARIHSGNKKLTNKGVWVARRNTTDATVNEVEAELRARMNPGAAPSAITANIALPNGGTVATNVPATTRVDPAFAAFNNQLSNVQQPVQNTQVDPRVIQPQQFQQANQQFQQFQQQTTEDYASLMTIVGGLFNSGHINPDYIAGFNQRLGVASINDIANDPQRVAQAYNLLRQDGKIQ